MAFDGDARQEATTSFLARIKDTRVAIERVWPEFDGGRFAVKRAMGDTLVVEADIFSDGHDKIGAALLLRREGEAHWHETPMRVLDNDRWRGKSLLRDNGRYHYTIIAWRDLYSSWRDEVSKKHDAGLAIDLELEEGRLILEAALQDEQRRRDPADRKALQSFLERHAAEVDAASRLRSVTSREVGDLMARAGPRTNLTRYDKELEVWVDRRRAAFSAWYEMFPRSQSGDVEPPRHIRRRDRTPALCARSRLRRALFHADPPDRSHEPQGPQQCAEGPGRAIPAAPMRSAPRTAATTRSTRSSVRSTISSGSLRRRATHGLEIALDFAIQCSPDHPWIKDHPEWFDWRPDGTIKFAENPPKKYEDIVNVHFYREAFPSIWHALRDVVLFWVGAWRSDLPRRQPAHQAIPVLGVADPRGARSLSRT